MTNQSEQFIQHIENDDQDIIIIFFNKAQADYFHTIKWLQFDMNFKRATGNITELTLVTMNDTVGHGKYWQPGTTSTYHIRIRSANIYHHESRSCATLSE